MNSTIEQLAVEAAESVVSEPCDLNLQTEDELGNKIVVPATFIKKFAELIVAECILTIQMGITRDGHDTEKYLRSMKHIKQIKEHFGVD